mmetsp:Transcript_130080/g.225150  ORF Transcript_130080/g.225150 Transcript_130080/m.225150 type:complete len:1077 (+) Transcript_130080:39-3269(+)
MSEEKTRRKVFISAEQGARSKFASSKADEANKDQRQAAPDRPRLLLQGRGGRGPADESKSGRKKKKKKQSKAEAEKAVRLDADADDDAASKVPTRSKVFQRKLKKWEQDLKGRLMDTKMIKEVMVIMKGSFSLKIPGSSSELTTDEKAKTALKRSIIRSNPGVSAATMEIVSAFISSRRQRPTNALQQMGLRASEEITVTVEYRFEMWKQAMKEASITPASMKSNLAASLVDNLQAELVEQGMEPIPIQKAKATEPEVQEYETETPYKLSKDAEERALLEAMAAADFFGDARKDVKIDASKVTSEGIIDSIYLIDNSRLGAPTEGFILRASPDMRDKADLDLVVDWGVAVYGRIVGEQRDWLRIGDYYMPTRINGIQVVIGGIRAHEAHLQEKAWTAKEIEHKARRVKRVREEKAQEGFKLYEKSRERIENFQMAQEEAQERARLRYIAWLEAKHKEAVALVEEAKLQARAAQRFQAAFRGWKVRGHYRMMQVERLKQERRLDAIEQNDNLRKLRRSAAAKIQRMWRGRKSRKIYQALKENREKVKEMLEKKRIERQAAMRIQLRFRGFKARKRLKAMRLQHEQELELERLRKMREAKNAERERRVKAATLLQCMIRKKKAIIAASKMRQEVQEHKLEEYLEAKSRRNQAALAAHRLYSKKPQSEYERKVHAALQIQRCWRCKVARKRVANLRYFREEAAKARAHLQDMAEYSQEVSELRRKVLTRKAQQWLRERDAKKRHPGNRNLPDPPLQQPKFMTFDTTARAWDRWEPTSERHCATWLRPRDWRDMSRGSCATPVEAPQVQQAFEQRTAWEGRDRRGNKVWLEACVQAEKEQKRYQQKLQELRTRRLMSAVTVQKRWRGYLARKWVHQRRQERKRSEQDALARRKLMEEEKRKVRVRTRLDKQLARMKRQAEEEKVRLERLQREMEEKAARRLQAAWRGGRVRRIVMTRLRLDEQRRRESAHSKMDKFLECLQPPSKPDPGPPPCGAGSTTEGQSGKRGIAARGRRSSQGLAMNQTTRHGAGSPSGDVKLFGPGRLPAAGRRGSRPVAKGAMPARFALRRPRSGPAFGSPAA